MSTSSSSVTTSTVNGTTRVTGLSSGIDVDSIVEQLMTAEKAKKLNQLQKKEQLAEWRQDAYRDIITDIQEFTSEYFDVTSSSSLLSTKNFNKYTVTSSSSAVTASSTSSATAGSHTVEVSQLATAATLKSSASISKDVQGAAEASYSSIAGTSFVIELDGTEYTVSFDSAGTYDDVQDVQDAIDAAVGEGKLTVSEDSSTGYLSITAATDSGVQEITISAPDSGTSSLTALGFGEDDAVLSNRLSTSSKLSAIADQLSTSEGLTYNSDGEIEFTINSTSFSFDSDDTLSTMINKVNSSGCGATLVYDELSGKLVLTADKTGAGNTLVVTDTGGNFASLLLSASTAGKDAKITVDGQSLTRSSNTITVGGVTYTLNATTDTDEDATVSLTLDTDGIYDLISSFVEDYNTLMSAINDKLDEDYDYDYPPLTDDQKEEMTDEEIEKWETQAKTGLLANDSLLGSFVSDLRTALIDSISGLSTGIFDIGISTGTYDEQGTLYIDEDELKEAIQSDPEAIMNLFTQQSSTYSGTTSVRSLSASQLSTRYKEEGIAYRIYDILQKNISTIRDSSGNKGLLLEKAGTDDDASDTDNALSTLIDKYEEEIEAEEDRLDDYEESLYDKYTTLETYISKMNTQLSALASYLDDSSS